MSGAALGASPCGQQRLAISRPPFAPLPHRFPPSPCSYQQADNRNRLALLQIDIQTVTMGLGICSMVSGFFGMNLSNSVCGPDGCIDYLTDPKNPSGWSSSSDHGHSYFVIVCIASVCAAATAMAVAFLKSRAASGDAFWSRALGTRKQRRGGGGLDE